MFPVLDNQPTLFDRLDALDWADVPVTAWSVDEDRGRHELRTIQVLNTNPADFAVPVPHARRRSGRHSAPNASARTTLGSTPYRLHLGCVVHGSPRRSRGAASRVRAEGLGCRPIATHGIHTGTATGVGAIPSISTSRSERHRSVVK